jgi:hypothetical protein
VRIEAHMHVVKVGRGAHPATNSARAMIYSEPRAARKKLAVSPTARGGVLVYIASIGGWQQHHAGGGTTRFYHHHAEQPMQHGSEGRRRTATR